MLHPAPGLLERQARHRTAHPALVAEILGRLSGNRPAPPPGPQLPIESLSESELRVLRYLPTNLTGPEIADELYVSLNTIRTHMRHLYAKLGTHRRAEAVACARDLGLLAPSPHRGQAARASLQRINHGATARAGAHWRCPLYRASHAPDGACARASRPARCGVTGRFGNRVPAGQILAADPDHGQRDDRRQRQDAGRDQVAPGEPGRQRMVVDLLDATPASSSRTLVSPTRKISTNSGPRPAPRTVFGPSIPPGNVLCSVIRDSQNIAPAAIRLPVISSDRAPIRVTACYVTTVVTRTAGMNGR